MKPFPLPSRVVLALSLCLFACSEATTGGAGVALPTISEGASVDAVADHLMAAQDARVATTALARTLPDLNRETAYQILVETLDRRLDGGARVRGWKLGGTRVTDPNASPDPIFGYSLDAHVYAVDQPLPASDFVGGRPEVEAELTILIGADLPGPTVTREQLMAAIRGVSGAVEVLSRRLAPDPADNPASLSPNHAIADNVHHGGVILGQTVVPADSLDFDAEIAVMRVNGEEVARGSAADIMGTAGNAIDGVLWLANELPKHGLFLKSGDYVVTGSVYTNPTVEPGDQAALEFSTLGTIAFTVGR